MAKIEGSSNHIEDGATVVVTHRVRDGLQSAYDSWIDEIRPACESAPGFVDWQIVRPVAGLTATYTVIIRFATHAHLESWMNSPQREQFIDKVRPILARDDDLSDSLGSGFLVHA